MADLTVVAQSEDTTIVSYEEVATVVSQEEVVTVVEVGFQGPAGRTGEQGIPGPAGGTTFSMLGDFPLGGHRVVVPEAFGLDVFPRYASNADILHAHKVLGVTISASAANEPVFIIRNGDVTEPSWNWVPNLPVYLGDNGLLTQTPPESPALFSLIVGFPVTATKLFVSIREPIIF